MLSLDSYFTSIESRGSLTTFKLSAIYKFCFKVFASFLTIIGFKIELRIIMKKYTVDSMIKFVTKSILRSYGLQRDHPPACVAN